MAPITTDTAGDALRFVGRVAGRAIILPMPRLATQAAVFVIPQGSCSKMHGKSGYRSKAKDWRKLNGQYSSSLLPSSFRLGLWDVEESVLNFANQQKQFLAINLSYIGLIGEGREKKI